MLLYGCLRSLETGDTKYPTIGPHKTLNTKNVCVIKMKSGSKMRTTKKTTNGVP